MPDLVVDWESGWTSVGWRIGKGAGSRKISIPWHIYLQAPSHLRDWWAISRFQKIALSKGFRDWWPQECGGNERALKRFMLRFPPGVWDIPWELLVGELDQARRSSISIVRALVDEPSTLPSCFDRPMSVLFIKGDDGSQTGRNRLDLDRECNLLLEAYDRLPVTHREAILRPRIARPTRADLSLIFQDAQTVPDLIFLSGHGSNNPPTFMLADGSPLTPEQFAKVISATAVRPVFIAFWACDTARGPTDSRQAPSPPFYAALLRDGVASLLAMQAPVTDRGAILLAQEVFQSLAGGDALDVAAARARAVLHDAWQAGAEGVNWLDWACPVVWSSGLPAARLAWRSSSSQLAQMQTTARRVHLNRQGRVFFPPTAAEIDNARSVAHSRLCWINADNLADHKERWIRLLLATQVVVRRYVVAVEFNNSSSDAAEGLRDWAEELQQTLEPCDAGADFRAILELMRSRPIEGWPRLCGLPDLVISIWSPPRYSVGDWFWATLVAGGAPVVVVGRVDAGAIVSDGWSVEDLDMSLNEDMLTAAHAEAPRVSDALALLSMPVPKVSIEALGTSLALVPKLEELVITTAANEVVLAASAARFFCGRMNEDAKRAAHRACMNILAHRAFAGRLTPAIREQRLTHCLGADESGAAVAEACALFVKYRALDRPRAALGVLQRLGPLWRDLPEHLLIIPAWAHMMLGDTVQADFWLRRSSADDVLDRAWQYGVQAEIDKARGDREAARDHIDAAIAALVAVPNEEKSPLIERRLRAYRQDRARILQYLFYEPAAAAAEYKNLLDDWLDVEDAAIDVAVVLRNYSECVRTDHHPGEPEWQQSKDMLDQAKALLQNNHDHPVFAELEYEKARVAIAEGALEARASLRAARDAATASGHLMLLAIVETRLFWQFEVFDLAKWIDLEVGLSAFPRHGWAVRTLIDGRLRAAKRMTDPALALQSMCANLEALDANPAFVAGSDRFRIAASSAGHDLLTAGPEPPPRWPKFLGLPWAAQWLESKGLRTPIDVWETVG
jgi:hypothetical protein